MKLSDELPPRRLHTRTCASLRSAGKQTGEPGRTIRATSRARPFSPATADLSVASASGARVRRRKPLSMAACLNLCFPQERLQPFPALISSARRSHRKRRGLECLGLGLLLLQAGQQTGAFALVQRDTRCALKECDGTGFNHLKHRRTPGHSFEGGAHAGCKSTARRVVLSPSIQFRQSQTIFEDHPLNSSRLLLSGDLPAAGPAGTRLRVCHPGLHATPCRAGRAKRRSSQSSTTGRSGPMRTACDTSSSLLPGAIRR